jgi:hypothetical protein
MNYKKPDTLLNLRRFLGILNYYRRCILLAAQHQAPLNELCRELRKNNRQKITRVPTAESAFQNCKISLAQAALLFHTYLNTPLALVTDASDVVIGASLEQKGEGHWKPFGFFSQKLTSTETRYCIYDWELLAIYAAIKFFQHMLKDKDFVIKMTMNPCLCIHTEARQG